MRHLNKIYSSTPICVITGDGYFKSSHPLFLCLWLLFPTLHLIVSYPLCPQNCSRGCFVNWIKKTISIKTHAPKPRVIVVWQEGDGNFIANVWITGKFHTNIPFQCCFVPYFVSISFLLDMARYELTLIHDYSLLDLSLPHTLLKTVAIFNLRKGEVSSF